jgi:predicted site-specific integrase-resolvase
MLFRRDDVERLSASNTVSALEMARHLGIKYQTLFAWIKKGKLHPISGPGVDGQKSYRFERAALEPPMATAV